MASYWEQVGGSILANDGSKELNYASEGLNNIFKNTNEAFNQGKKDIDAFTSIFSKDGAIAQAAEAADKSNDAMALQEAEQLAKQSEDSKMNLEIAKIAQSIGDKLTNIESFNSTGMNLANLNQVINNSFDNIYTKTKGDGSKFSSSELRNIASNPTLLNQYINDKSLSEAQRNQLHEIRNDPKLVSAVNNYMALSAKQAVRASGGYTDGEKQDIARLFVDYKLQNDHLLNTTESQLQGLLTLKQNEVLNLKPGESLQEMLLRVDNAMRGMATNTIGLKEKEVGKNEENNQESEQSTNPKSDTKSGNKVKGNKTQTGNFNTTESNEAVNTNPYMENDEDAEIWGTEPKKYNLNNLSIDEITSGEYLTNDQKAQIEKNEKNGYTGVLIDPYDELIPTKNLHDKNEYIKNVKTNLNKIHPKYRKEFLDMVNYFWNPVKNEKSQEAIDSIVKNLFNSISLDIVDTEELGNDRSPEAIVNYINRHPEVKKEVIQEISKELPNWTLEEIEEAYDRHDKYTNLRDNKYATSVNKLTVSKEFKNSEKAIKDSGGKINYNNQEIEKNRQELQQNFGFKFDKDGTIINQNEVLNTLSGDKYKLANSLIKRNNTLKEQNTTYATKALEDYQNLMTETFGFSFNKGDIEKNNEKMQESTDLLTSLLGTDTLNMYGIKSYKSKGVEDHNITFVVARSSFGQHIKDNTAGRNFFKNVLSPAFNDSNINKKLMTTIQRYVSDDKYKNNPTLFRKELQEEFGKSGSVINTIRDEIHNTLVDSAKGHIDPNFRTRTGEFASEVNYKNYINDIIEKMFRIELARREGLSEDELVGRVLEILNSRDNTQRK